MIDIQNKSFFPWPNVCFLAKYMVLEEGSLSYDMWKELPIPMYTKVYYFNCTNHEDVVAKIAKPLWVSKVAIIHVSF